MLCNKCHNKLKNLKFNFLGFLKKSKKLVFWTNFPALGSTEDLQLKVHFKGGDIALNEKPTSEL